VELTEEQVKIVTDYYNEGNYDTVFYVELPKTIRKRIEEINNFIYLDKKVEMLLAILSF